MNHVSVWITRLSAMVLAATSISTFAASDAPNYLMHQANVRFKVSEQGSGKIESDTYKTKNLINVLMGRSVDAKNAKDEKLGLVTGCATDPGAAALVVFNKKTEEVMTDSAYLIMYIDGAVTQVDNNGNDKKSDLLGYVSEAGGWLDASGSVRYGKIGNKVAKGGGWNKDTICAKNFKSKSIVGASYGLLGPAEAIVMDGKISAGSARFGAEAGIWPGVDFAISKTATGVSNGLDYVNAAGNVISYAIGVTNLSDDTQATGVVVSDLRAGVSVDCGGQDTLDPGMSMNCTASYSVQAADFDVSCGATGTGTIENTATVTADGSDSFEANEFVTVDCDDSSNPGDVIAVSKSANKEFAAVDEVITYTIDITNLSAEAQTGVAVSDLHAGMLLDCGNVTELAPAGEAGDAFFCTGLLTVTEAVRDEACAKGGYIRNAAVVSSDQSAPDAFAADNLVGVACPG